MTDGLGFARMGGPRVTARDIAEYHRTMDAGRDDGRGLHFASTCGGRYPSFVCAYCLLPREEWNDGDRCPKNR